MVRYENVVHYAAPPWEAVQPMVSGLASFLALTQGASVVARAAVASFGFVYIHPLADGNGRVHRFLINDSLRRDGSARARAPINDTSFVRKRRQSYGSCCDVRSTR